MTLSFTSFDVRPLTTTGDYDNLMARACVAYDQRDFRAAQALSMAAAIVATSSADEEVAINCAAHAMGAAAAMQPDPNPEQPAVLPPVRLSRGVPVYRVSAGGTFSGAYYGEAPAGSSWTRA